MEMVSGRQRLALQRRAIPGPRPRTSRASPRACALRSALGSISSATELPRLVALLARALQQDIRIGAKGDQFLEVSNPIAQAPQAPSGRCYEEEQTTFIVELVGPLAWLRSCVLLPHSVTAYNTHIPQWAKRTPIHTPGLIAAPLNTVRRCCTRKACYLRHLATYWGTEGRPGTGELDSGKG